MSQPNQNTDLQERSKQVLQDVTQLQVQEQNLYNSLEDESLSDNQRQIIINKINEISQIRVNLYSSLYDIYDSYQQSAITSNDTLTQSMKAVEVLEKQLNQSKKRLNSLKEQKTNAIRLIEINNYYGQRYQAHTEIMKRIVYVCLPIMFLTFLVHVDIMPLKLYALLVGIVIVIGVVYIGPLLVNLSNRDTRYWDEYNWYFDKSKAPSNTPKMAATDTINPWQLSDVDSGTCIGSACCSSSSVFDSVKNVCVPNPSSK